MCQFFCQKVRVPIWQAFLSLLNSKLQIEDWRFVFNALHLSWLCVIMLQQELEAQISELKEQLRNREQTYNRRRLKDEREKTRLEEDMTVLRKKVTLGWILGCLTGNIFDQPSLSFLEGGSTVVVCTSEKIEMVLACAQRRCYTKWPCILWWRLRFVCAEVYLRLESDGEAQKGVKAMGNLFKNTGKPAKLESIEREVRRLINSQDAGHTASKKTHAPSPRQVKKKVFLSNVCSKTHAWIALLVRENIAIHYDVSCFGMWKGASRWLGFRKRNRLRCGIGGSSTR